MSQLDDLFRDGLGGRKADLPDTNRLWAGINAGRKAPVPSGEELDRTFRDGLSGRRAAVPAGMWARIAAARRPRRMLRWLPAAALVLLLIGGGLGYALLGDGGKRGSAPGEFTTSVIAAAAESRVDDAPVAEEETERSPIAEESAHAAETTTTSSARPAVAPSTGLPAGQAGAVVEADLTERTGASATAAADGPRVLQPESRAAAVAVSHLPAAGLTTTDSPQRALPEVSVDPDPFVSRRARRGLRTELLFGVSYARQELQQREGNGQLREVREISEFPEVGYQISLRTTYQLSDRLRLLAGLTYAEIRNELDYDTFVGGNAVRVTTNNQLRLLEAPLLLGYTVPARRVNFTVNAGPVVNLALGARGRFLHPDFAQPLDLRTDGGYRSNVGIGFQTSITTAYRIGRERPFTLLLEPFFKAYPTPFTVADAPLREKYWVAGMQLGVRKEL